VAWVKATKVHVNFTGLIKLGWTLVSFVISNHGLRNSGGIEHYLQTLVTELHARGVRPTVIALHLLARFFAESDVPIFCAIAGRASR